MTLTMNELRCQHWSRVYAAAISRGATINAARVIADDSMAVFNRRWGIS